MDTKPPANHQWIETLDGTKTLFSERFQEACHSTSGAREETLLHYLKGCLVQEKIQKKNISILEVGFGLGLGFVTTFETLTSSPHEFHFLSLELDEELIRWTFDDLVRRSILQDFTQSENVFRSTFPGGTLEVLCGDARRTLAEFVAKKPQQFDAIYQDAFSPKKNPSLWTTEWFSLLKNSSTEDVILSTYSASSSIRKSLIAAGWKIHRGEKFGPKRTSTRATLVGVTDPEILLQLERSHVSALTDSNFMEYANEKRTL